VHFNFRSQKPMKPDDWKQSILICHFTKQQKLSAGIAMPSHSGSKWLKPARN